MNLPRVKIDAVPAAPVHMNAAATVDKAVSFIVEAADNGANLVVFPEFFMPGFPVWAALARMVANSILVDGSEMAAICAAAKPWRVCIARFQRKHSRER